jgi:uncharacterized protein YgiM (DUF1202 family)
MKYIIKGLALTSVFYLIFISGILAQEAIVIASVLNLRSGPGTEYSVTGKLVKGQKVSIVSKEGKWYYISVLDKQGYVFANYLKLTSSQPAKIATDTQKYREVKSEQSVLICVSKNAYAYHKYYCRGLNRCTHTVKSVKVSEAKALGYRPCGNCY